MVADPVTQNKYRNATPKIAIKTDRSMKLMARDRPCESFARAPGIHSGVHAANKTGAMWACTARFPALMLPRNEEASKQIAKVSRRYTKER